ncbi:MAG: alpha/beta fold hydrolase [Gemmatimonadetes bacterium]|nr:alpha/beta fold hydrolase [Gemmatimonadota bacterium]
MTRPATAKRHARFTFLALATLFALGAPLDAQEDSPLIGDWIGTINAGGGTLRLRLAVEAGTEGLRAQLFSIDQGNQAIPVESIELAGRTVTFASPAIGVTYEGELSSDGSTIAGTFTQMGQALPLDLERGEGEAPPARPQDPEEPLPYHSEDVSFENPDGGHRLAGTFTRPDGAGPYPGVILISGSGPQDRDEALMGHRPFLVLSDHLTRAGIAVLRFDDRGVGESTGDFGTATSFDFASDARAAVEFLKERPDVDPARIGLAGHSEGGLVAPIVAADSDDLAFIVLMAGPGVTGEEILYAQMALISEAGGATPEAVAKSRAYAERTYAVLKSDLGPDEALSELREIAEEQMAEATPEELATMGLTEETKDAMIEGQLAAVNSPWFRAFLTYDPAPTLERVSIPVLAINGEKDLQVPYEVNLREIAAALERGGNPHFETHALPDLNHLFQHADTGHPSEYGTIEETWAPEAMELIANWIHETVSRPVS